MARGPGLPKAVLDEEPGPLPVSNRSGPCRKGSGFGKPKFARELPRALKKDARGCQNGSKQRIF